MKQLNEAQQGEGEPGDSRGENPQLRDLIDRLIQRLTEEGYINGPHAAHHASAR